MQVRRPQDALGLTHRLEPGGAAVGAELAIEPGDRAVFVQHGRVLGTLGAGRHALDPRVLPFVQWAVRPGSHVLDCEIFFVRERGTVDVDGDVGHGLSIEAVLEVEVADPTIAVQHLAMGRSLDEVVDHQLFRALPAVIDRVAAQGFSDDMDAAAEAIAHAAEHDGLGFAQLGARFVGFEELHIHEGGDDEGGPAGGGFGPGAPVLAQSSDGRWAPGTIVQMQAGRIEVAWDDGRRGWVTPYQVRPT